MLRTRPKQETFAVGVQEAMAQPRGIGASWQLVGEGLAPFNSVIKTFWKHKKPLAGHQEGAILWLMLR